jgi:rod shape determining protein RodA
MTMLQPSIETVRPRTRWSRVLACIDPFAPALALTLTAVGIINLAGMAQSALPGSEAATWWSRQLRWAEISIALMLVLAVIDYRWLVRWAPVGYLVGLGLLALVHIFPRESHGQSLWVQIPGLPSFQPAEFTKLATLLMLAWVLSWPKNPPRRLWSLIPAAILAIIPCLWVLAQGDLGTAVIFAPMTLAMCYAAGYRLGLVAALLSPALGLLGISRSPIFAAIWLGLLLSIMLWMLAEKMLLVEITILIGINIVVFITMFTWFDTVWGHLKPYQRERIVAFWNPQEYADTTGWQYLQTMITVGSGGMSGQGWGQGPQSKLHYLPEYHTDFAFATLAEEWGLVGGLVLLLLLLLYVLRAISIGSLAGCTAGSCLGAGIAAVAATHILINISMNVGLMPITGLPLSFISYGGSFLLTSFMCTGLLMSVYARRFSALALPQH